jgi:hypothetical protein
MQSMLVEHAHKSGQPAPQSADPVYRNAGVQASEGVYVLGIPELQAPYALLCAAKATFHAACLQHFANVAAAPLVPQAAVSAEVAIEQLKNGWHKRITFRAGGRRDCVYVLPAHDQGGQDVVVGSLEAMHNHASWV